MIAEITKLGACLNMYDKPESSNGGGGVFKIYDGTPPGLACLRSMIAGIAK